MQEKVSVVIHYPDGYRSDGFMAREALPAVGADFVNGARVYRVKSLDVAQNPPGMTPNDGDWVDYDLQLEDK
jgi:hypothetical protein